MLTGLKFIPQDHIRAKARLLSEGVQGELPAPPDQEESGVEVDPGDIEQILRCYAGTMKTRRQTPIKELGNVIRFDDSGVHAPIIINPYSRLRLRRDGERVTVLDGDRALVQGTLPAVPGWWQRGKLSNGLPVKTVLPAMSEGIINLAIHLSCINVNSGQGCRYCNLFANPIARKLGVVPLETLEGYARYQAEAVKMALDHGWDGQITISGGALAPAQRGEYLQRLQIVLEALGEAVGKERYDRLQKVYNHYPPEDLQDLVRWKELGITATCIDLEVMDAATFAAICPGKHAYQPLPQWKRAQEASVEVFGPYTGTMSMLVMGMEPLETLLRGTEERLQKGVLPLPFVFYSAPGSACWGFRPPTADWLAQGTEKIAELFMAHLARILQAIQRTKDRAPSAPSLANCLLFDELQRRAAALLSPGASAAAPGISV